MFRCLSSLIFVGKEGNRNGIKNRDLVAESVRDVAYFNHAANTPKNDATVGQYVTYIILKLVQLHSFFFYKNLFIRT